MAAALFHKAPATDYSSARTCCLSLQGVSEFSDVTLVVEDQSALEAHKVVLSAKNPFKRTNMEDEFWIQASDGTTLPVLYTKNTAIAVIKRTHNQHPADAVEPKISKTFEKQVIHEARNTLFRKVS